MRKFIAIINGSTKLLQATDHTVARWLANRRFRSMSIDGTLPGERNSHDIAIIDPEQHGADLYIADDGSYRSLDGNGTVQVRDFMPDGKTDSERCDVPVGLGIVEAMEAPDWCEDQHAALFDDASDARLA